MKLRVLAASIVAACALAACGGSHVQQSALGSVHPAGWGGTPKGYVAPPVTGAMLATPTSTMYDAVATGNIPPHPFAAAGYTAGNFVTWPTIRAIAKHAVSIAIQANFHADCLDIEPGDATPDQAGGWALADIRAGFAKPCEYSDLSEMPAVQASDRAALGPDWRAKVFLWLAWYRGFPGLVPGYDAVQYWDHCLGLSLDCSTVTLAFLSIAQPPYVAPVPPKPKPKPTFNQEFDSGFQRGFTVRWDQRHRLAVPAARHLIFGPGFNPGYDAGWKAAR